MLHKTLRNVRKFHQMSVNQAAAEMGVSPSYISEIENGKKRIHQDILDAYAETFNLPISSFYLIAESSGDEGGARKRSVRRKIANIISWIASD